MERVDLIDVDGLGSLLVTEFEERLRQHDRRVAALANTRAGCSYEALGYLDHASYYRKVM